MVHRAEHDEILIDKWLSLNDKWFFVIREVGPWGSMGAGGGTGGEVGVATRAGL